jgi:hypothetical protein
MLINGYILKKIFWKLILVFNFSIILLTIFQALLIHHQITEVYNIIYISFLSILQVPFYLVQGTLFVYGIAVVLTLLDFQDNDENHAFFSLGLRPFQIMKPILGLAFIYGVFIITFGRWMMKKGIAYYNHQFGLPINHFNPFMPEKKKHMPLKHQKTKSQFMPHSQWIQIQNSFIHKKQKFYWPHRSHQHLKNPVSTSSFPIFLAQIFVPSSEGPWYNIIKQDQENSFIGFQMKETWLQSQHPEQNIATHPINTEIIPKYFLSQFSEGWGLMNNVPVLPHTIKDIQMPSCLSILSSKDWAWIKNDSMPPMLMSLKKLWITTQFLESWGHDAQAYWVEFVQNLCLPFVLMGLTWGLGRLFLSSYHTSALAIQGFLFVFLYYIFEKIAYVLNYKGVFPFAGAWILPFIFGEFTYLLFLAPYSIKKFIIKKCA